MAKEIKQRIVLEGEKQYNQAINEAKRNLKTLRSEMKAETAELGANATAQQRAEVKTRSLKEQIKEQEKIVKTLREALKQVQAEYGDNADEVARWQQRLNDARTVLGNMRNDLDRTGQGMRQVASDASNVVTATRSAAESMASIGQAGEKIAGSIETAFKTMLDYVTEAAGKVWELIAESAAKANNWNDLASYFGSSADAMQMWDRSISAAGGSFESFIGIINQLTYMGKDKDIAESLGISKEEYQDDVKYVLAVMDKLEQRKKELSQNEFDELLGGLFGRKSRELNWFLSNAHGHEAENGEWINGWRDNPEQWSSQGPFGASVQELQTLNDVYVQMETIDAKWDAIKTKIAAGLGTAALSITTSVDGILTGLSEYMSAGTPAEKQEALDKIEQNMIAFFEAVGQIVGKCIEILKEVGEDLKKSDNPAVAFVGEIMTALADALEWITEHYQEVVVALEAIFGMWLVAKIIALAGGLSSFLANVETIKRLRGLGGSGLLGGGAGAGGTGMQTVTTETVTTQTVSQATVANMVVQNMVGGPGMNPTTPVTNPVVGSTPPVNTINLTAGVPLIGAGAGAATLPAGNAAQNVLTGSQPLALEGDVGAVNTNGAVVLNANEFSIGDAARVTAADKLAFGGLEMGGRWAGFADKISQIATSPAAVAGIAMLMGTPLAGKILSGASFRGALTEYYGEKYTEASAGEKLDMEMGDSPEMAKLKAQGKGSHWYDSGIFADISDALDKGGLWVKHGAEDLVEDVKTGWNGMWDLINYETFGGEKYAKRAEEAQKKLFATEETEAEKRAREAEERAEQKRQEQITRLAQWAGENGTGYQAPGWFPENWGDMTPEERMAFVTGIQKYPGQYDASGITNPMIRRGFESGDAAGIMAALQWIENGGRTLEEVQRDRLRESEWMNQSSLPSGWWAVMSTGLWNGLKSPNENGVSEKTLEGLAGMPAGVENAAEKGVRKGISGMRVEIDGQAAGRILAPYVSQEIARSIG